LKVFNISILLAGKLGCPAQGIRGYSALQGYLIVPGKSIWTASQALVFDSWFVAAAK